MLDTKILISETKIPQQIVTWDEFHEFLDFSGEYLPVVDLDKSGKTVGNCHILTPFNALITTDHSSALIMLTMNFFSAAQTKNDSKLC